MGSQTKKRNTPVILIGIILLLAITLLRSQIGGGVVAAIIQVLALVMILYGFGMSWTRKGKKTNKKQTTRSTAQPVDSTELIKVWRDITDGNNTWGWKPIVAAIAHINTIPESVVDVAQKTNGSAANRFPRQVNGYDGVLWIAREDAPYEPDHMLVFSPVFSDMTDKKWWENIPLMLCPDIESLLDLKEAAVNTLVINDDVKMTPLTNDKDFSVLTALLKTRHYKDLK